MSKTLYQSGLVALGEVAVTVKSDVLQSKFKKDQRYVVLLIDGEEKNFNLENDVCADFFDGQKGSSFVLLAEGSREDAILTYIGDATEQPTAPPAKAKAPPRKPAPKPPATPPAQRTAPPAAAAPAQAPASRPPAQPNGGTYRPQGATVGMAINQACEFVRAEITAGLVPPARGVYDGKRITEIASRLLEIARWLEAGNLLAKQVAPAGTAAPEPSDNDGAVN